MKYMCKNLFRTSNYFSITKTRKFAEGATGALLAIAFFTTLAEGYQSQNNCKKPTFLHYKSFRTGRKMSSTKIPAAYIPHGGGPLPILGDKQHVDLVKWLEKFVSTNLVGEKKPTSCLVISAHWEERQTTLQSGDTTELYYDYYGFPEETYNLKYKLPGAKDLAKRVSALLDSANIPYQVNTKRGYDHGVFIPMMMLFPSGDIPTIQLSLMKGLDPATHIRLGEALAPLREEGVLLLGSGMREIRYVCPQITGSNSIGLGPRLLVYPSLIEACFSAGGFVEGKNVRLLLKCVVWIDSYHNMRGFNNAQSNQDSEPFHEYLRNNLVKAKSYTDRKAALEGWAKAPKARECHPREEHFMPLHVILGSTKNDANVKVKEDFFSNVAGVKCAGYIFD